MTGTLLVAALWGSLGGMVGWAISVLIARLIRRGRRSSGGGI